MLKPKNNGVDNENISIVFVDSVVVGLEECQIKIQFCSAHEPFSKFMF